MINGREGTVQDIRLFNTKILTFNNEEVIIPNSDVLSQTLVNESNMPLRRVELPFYISYSADAGLISQRIVKELYASENIINTPEPSVSIDAFGEDTIKCTAYAWASTENYGNAKNDVRQIIYKAVRNCGGEPSSRKVKIDSCKKEGD